MKGLAGLLCLLFQASGSLARYQDASLFSGKRIQAGHDSDFGLGRYLPSVNGTLSSPSRADERCAFPPSLQDFGCQAPVEMYSMEIEDCGTPWTLCYCPGAEGSAEDAMEGFSSIPIGALSSDY